MRNRMRRTALGALTFCLMLPLLSAQNPAARGQTGGRGARGGRGAQPAAPSKPTPHWPDGRVNLSQTPDTKGFWNVMGGSPIGTTGTSLPTNLTLEQVPFQDWARALY